MLQVALSTLVHGEGVALCFLLAISILILVLIFHHLSTVEDVNRDARSVGHVCRHLGDLPDSVHAFDHLTEDDMLAIQVLALLERDEELR